MCLCVVSVQIFDINVFKTNCNAHFDMPDLNFLAQPQKMARILNLRNLVTGIPHI